jgi:prophage regulatory protein
MGLNLQLLRLSQVRALTGLSRASIYAKATQGQFPKPVKLGARASAWIASEVQDWIATRVALSRGHEATDSSYAGARPRT